MYNNKLLKKEPKLLCFGSFLSEFCLIGGVHNFIGDVHNFIGELEVPNDFFQLLCHKSVRYITVGGSETLYNVSV
ncbi:MULTISPECIES: hypothetical protein [unclassified Mesobacillus]|uniref:hypothetical protein n=1 Tax=unclassified Mesobacillus TaxID=2675270 RepID=UPI00203D7394|nr:MULTISPECIES: hypothetical protein [unclassified Mesobacillus]MCM3124641.1 hypothetical protein [Mesobacillus sp. MER 33]MCM3234649.1 hypothetical protein [Mesobacillus sp. MER 48]